MLTGEIPPCKRQFAPRRPSRDTKPLVKRTKRPSLWATSTFGGGTEVCKCIPTQAGAISTHKSSLFCEGWLFFSGNFTPCHAPATRASGRGLQGGNHRVERVPRRSWPPVLGGSERRLARISSLCLQLGVYGRTGRWNHPLADGRLSQIHNSGRPPSGELAGPGARTFEGEAKYGVNLGKSWPFWLSSRVAAFAATRRSRGVGVRPPLCSQASRCRQPHRSRSRCRGAGASRRELGSP